jgi:ABC-type arginine/histidine transport system permease subunit
MNTILLSILLIILGYNIALLVDFLRFVETKKNVTTFKKSYIITFAGLTLCFGVLFVIYETFRPKDL